MRKFLAVSLCILLGLVVVYFFSDNTSLDFTRVVRYNGSNLRLSIDGEESNSLPTDGNYYLVSYECESSNTELTWDRINHKLEVSNGNEKSGVACYLDFQSNPSLSDMSIGSYVKYLGNNGCSGSSCSGENVNYVSDNDMGYSGNSNNKFIVSGFRIGYKKNNSAYLVSAGALESVATDYYGNSSASGFNTYEESSSLLGHLSNLSKAALKYCNVNYAYNGVCDSNSAWNISDKDFKLILGNKRGLSSCLGSYSDKECGYNNDLIDNGSYYWFSNVSTESFKAYIWSGSRVVSANYSKYAYGVRPVLRLSSSVVVTGGSGTYEDPYTIGNNTVTLNKDNKYVTSSNKEIKVDINLMATSNVRKMCISVDSTGCSNYIDFSNTYTLDLTGTSDGKKQVYIYYKDSDDKIVASMNRSIIVDTKAPLNNSIKIEGDSGLTRNITVFSKGADKMCFSNESSNSLDCNNWVDYSTSYTWRLSDNVGEKTVYAFFKDKAGNVSSTSDTINVTSTLEYVVNEDFNDSVYDSNLEFSSDDYSFVVISNRFQSTNSGINNSTSSSSITFTPSVDAIMSFSYGVSTEANYDKFSVVLVGSNSTSLVLVDNISGSKSGKIENVNLVSGVTYNLVLSYVKDSSGATLADVAYIDDLVIQS